MPYGVKQFFEIIKKYQDHWKNLERALNAGTRSGKIISEMSDDFRRFVDGFEENEKEAAYVIIFMFGVIVGRKNEPEILFEDKDALKKMKKPDDVS